MRAGDFHLSENDMGQPRGVVAMVRADRVDQRSWLAAAPVCVALKHQQIRHVGVAHAPAPFKIVRTRLGGSYFLACFGGQGRVLVDGRWTRCGPGKAALLPPGTLQAFHTTPRQTWDICWVRYQEASGQKPLAAASTPVLAKFDPEPLRLAILGLHREAKGPADVGLAQRWVELIDLSVRRFAQPTTLDERLWKLWHKVSEDLGQSWSVTAMARMVHLSEKQLQRLCLRELGRTPRRQLIWLRMRQAADLLARTQGKIETIAGQVGYQNPFVFSTTFKRVMGCSPSAYPRR